MKAGGAAPAARRMQGQQDDGAVALTTVRATRTQPCCVGLTTILTAWLAALQVGGASAACAVSPCDLRGACLHGARSPPAPPPSSLSQAHHWLPRFRGCAVSAAMRLTASWAPARRPVHSGRRQRLPVRVRRRLLRPARECLPAPHASPGTWLRSLPPPLAAAPPPPLRFSALGNRALDCSTLNVRVADSAGSAPSASPSTGTSFGRVGALLTWAFQQQRADPLGFDSGRASCADADECASRPCQHGITSHGRHGHSRN